MVDGQTVTDQPTVTTNLVMPPDFATAPYNAVHTRVEPHNAAYPFAWEQYAGAWNAVAYRFHACADHDAVFTASVQDAGTTPPQPARYIQEREFFNFLVNGLATIESLCYAFFAIGAMMDAHNFPIATPKDLLRITPKLTDERYALAFSGEAVSGSMARLLASEEYKDWKETRGLLAHRSVPGRMIRLTVSATIAWGKGPASPNPPPEERTRWTNGIAIDATTTSSRRAWLAATTDELLEAASALVSSRL